MKDKSLFTVNLVSFGFRYGLPPEAEMVIDVRFLKNPHWDESLRSGTGREQGVGAYIERDRNFHLFIAQFHSFAARLLPLYAYGERRALTIALGCTGGRHRSVYAAEKLKPWLEGQGFSVSLVHRDIDH